MATDYHIHISSKHNPLDLKLKEVWQYRDLIYLFTKRSFTVTYKQTILGPLWIFISPLLTSLMYTFIFGNIAKLGTDGIPQLLFYFSGNALWSFFASCVNNNASTFIDNAHIFGKVYFPRLTVPISNVLSSLIRFFVSMLVVVALMVYYHIAPSLFSIIIIPILLILVGLLGMGLGIIFSSLTTKYRDLSVLISFGITLWMYATPVVYPLSTISGAIRQFVLLNPMTQIMEVYRYFLLGVGSIEIPYLLLSILITILVIILGIILFNKVERNFMDIV